MTRAEDFKDEEREVLEEFREVGVLNVGTEELLNDPNVQIRSLDEVLDYVDYDPTDKLILPDQQSQRRRRGRSFIIGKIKGRVPKPNALQAFASTLLFGKRTPTLKHRPHKKARPSYSRPKPSHVTHKNKKRPSFRPIGYTNW